MKIVIFSDTHLSSQFDSEKYKFLKSIINSSDKVIIAGDFWEGRVISFSEFINSKWSSLFPFLKEKKCIYVFGNHDPKSIMDKRVNLFSVEQTDMYSFSSGKKLFKVVHGDKYVKKLPRAEGLLNSKYTTIWLHDKAEGVLTKLFGARVLKLLYGKYNKQIKNKTKGNEILICGHTHFAEIDLPHNFINTGMIRHGIGEYVVIENEKVSLQDERY